MAVVWRRALQGHAVYSDVGLEAVESMTVEPEGLPWEGQISHQRDEHGGVEGDLDDSSLNNWIEGYVVS